MEDQPKIIATRTVIAPDGNTCCMLMLDESGKIHCNGDPKPLFQPESYLHEKPEHAELLEGQWKWARNSQP